MAQVQGVVGMEGSMVLVVDAVDSMARVSALDEAGSILVVAQGMAGNA